MQIGDVVHSEPLSTLEIEIGPEYIRVCEAWLQIQGCSITHVQEEHYLIHFPEGTQETIYFGTSGVYTRRTSVVFPSGTVLPKYVAYPINKKQQGKRVTMGFPSGLFQGNADKSIMR